MTHSISSDDDPLYAYDVEGGPCGVTNDSHVAVRHICSALRGAPVGTGGILRKAQLTDLRGGLYAYGSVRLWVRRVPGGLVGDGPDANEFAGELAAAGTERLDVR